MKLRVLDTIVVTSIRPQALARGDVTPDLPAAEARDLMKRLPGYFEEAQASADPVQERPDPAPQADGPHGTDSGRKADDAAPSVGFEAKPARRAPETRAADAAPETEAETAPKAAPAAAPARKAGKA